MILSRLKSNNMNGYMNLLGFMKADITLLKFGGFYPIKTRKYKILHSISASFFLTLTVLYNVFTTIYGFLHLSEVEVLSEIVAFLMTLLAYMVKLVNMILYRNNFLLLEDMLKSPILTELQSIEEDYLVKQGLRSSRLFTNIFKTIATIAATVHAIFPLIDHGERKFLFLLWFPFNAEKHFITVYFFEAILLVSSTWFDITLDALNVVMMDLCAVQFQLLNSRLTRIPLKYTGNDVIDDKLRIQKLKKYIIHHNYIYSCSELIEKTYSIGVFSQIVSSIIVVCFGLFKSLVTPLRSMQFLMLATYSLTMICQVTLYCCYGQKLLDASNTVTEACYMSEWNDCSVEVQKYLVMIMNRANRPVLVKAGGIFTLTLETLMTIYTSSYSFFAILWQVYNTED